MDTFLFFLAPPDPPQLKCLRNVNPASRKSRHHTTAVRHVVPTLCEIPPPVPAHLTESKFYTPTHICHNGPLLVLPLRVPSQLLRRLAMFGVAVVKVSVYHKQCSRRLQPHAGILGPSPPGAPTSTASSVSSSTFTFALASSGCNEKYCSHHQNSYLPASSIIRRTSVHST